MRMLQLLRPALALNVLWYNAESTIAASSWSRLHQDVVQEQRPLVFEQLSSGEIAEVRESIQKRKQWKGRFLHITDLHPDPYYKTYSSTSTDKACHHGSGPAGYYGAETTDCDSPISLVNATFDWIDRHLADKIDFVVWTGDSARHDNDESIPRDKDQVVSQNEFLVEKFREIFGKHNGDEEDDDPTNDFKVPIVPTLGNNDILPHNILLEGPNQWTREYTSVWQSFIPEEQRHAFEQGGWFYTEVIPDRLAVFSLNTLYFFTKNAAVDGCATPSDPGYEAFEWLRVRLQLLRERGMKAILSGHVPPARTASKQQWDETCWQKYALWLRQYRDVVVGGVWGHMNVEHFMLQDFQDIRWDILDVNGDEEWHTPFKPELRKRGDSDFSTASTGEYLKELRSQWTELPRPPSSMLSEKFAHDLLSSISDNARPEWEIDHFAQHHHRFSETEKNKDEKKREEFLKKIGGKWHERYSVSLVSASVVPNFFPTLRVFEYNTTGVEEWNTFDKHGKTNLARAEAALQRRERNRESLGDELIEHGEGNTMPSEQHDQKGKPEKSKKPKFTLPDPPSKSAPPGPAYSPQSLTLLGYTQYYANLTEINNDFHKASVAALMTKLEEADDDEMGVQQPWMDWLGGIWRWKEGKHKGKKPKKPKPQPKEFTFQVEYNTQHDKVYMLKDLTVGNLVHLARRIGKKGKIETDEVNEDEFEDDGTRIERLEEATAEKMVDVSADGGDEDVEIQKKHKKKKGKKRKHTHNKVWHTFIKRAFVSTKDAGEIDDTYG